MIYHQNHHLHRNYPDIFLAIIDGLAANIPALKNTQTTISQLSNTKEACSAALSIARDLVESRPLAKLKILEIGGPFGQLLHSLGADAWCVDPDINGFSEFQQVNWHWAPTIEPNRYHAIPKRLTAANWRDLLEPQSFDLTFTRIVLDKDSGTSSDWRKQLQEQYYLDDNLATYLESSRKASKDHEEAERQARRALFIISSEATRSGGLVIHQGADVVSCVTDPGTVNLELLEQRPTCNEELENSITHIYRKIPQAA